MFFYYGPAWIDTKILACQSFGKPKFWPLFGWVSKFVHLSHFPYQNVGKFFAQHLASQNFGMPKFWHQSKQALHATRASGNLEPLKRYMFVGCTETH